MDSDAASLAIRSAHAGDAEAIRRIYNQAVTGSTATFDTEPETLEKRAEWLAAHDPRHPVLVAVADGEVVAWGALSAWHERPAYDPTVETSTYVDATWAGRGIGRALGERLLDLARQLGHHAVIAQISSENEASVALAERLGFERVGTLREVGLKFGRRLDVLIYERIVGGDRR